MKWQSSDLKRVGLGSLAWMCIAVPQPACSADAISTDRPDFVESAEVVGRGRFQIETSYAAERSERDGTSIRTRSTPTLLRLGVSDSVELRLEADGDTQCDVYRAASGMHRRDNGFSDLSIGAKWRVREADDARQQPRIALLAHIDVDSGSPAFRGYGRRPSLRAVAEWELDNEWSIGVMPGFIVDREADGPFLAGIFAVTLGKSWNPSWRSFVEISGQQLVGKVHGGSYMTLDAGLAYLVTNDLQLDIVLSRGLTSAAPDFLWGLGVSVRF